MAVYELNNGQLLRVARSIDGKLQQQYFSLIGLNKTNQRGVRREAKALDQAWQEAQDKAKSKRVREASTDRNATSDRRSGCGPAVGRERLGLRDRSQRGPEATFDPEAAFDPDAAFDIVRM